jgi:hypothetical protein
MVALARCLVLGAFVFLTTAGARQNAPDLPSTPLTFGFFTARFSTDGTFALEGEGWPAFRGTWTRDGAEIQLSTPGVRDCGGPGRYRFSVDASLVRFDLVTDECTPRRMILDRSTWRPLGKAQAIPPRRIVRSVSDRLRPLPAAASAAGSWLSFRGRDARVSPTD